MHTPSSKLKKLLVVFLVSSIFDFTASKHSLLHPEPLYEWTCHSRVRLIRELIRKTVKYNRKTEISRDLCTSPNFGDALNTFYQDIFSTPARLGTRLPHSMIREVMHNYMYTYVVNNTPTKLHFLSCSAKYYYWQLCYWQSSISQHRNTCNVGPDIMLFLGLPWL